MSNSERKENLPEIIKTAEPTFTDLAKGHGIPDFTFARECAFALQILKQNSFLADVACGNPDSLKDAIINVAAVGLSLSPVHKQSYLIPRKNKGGKMAVCLDISYQGLIDLATSRGAILWAKAELVYAKDQFEFLGINLMPKHKTKDAFGDRGAIIGGYCVAKMPSGDLLVDRMSVADIYKRRDRSDSYKAYKSGDAKSTPWVGVDEPEMMKKTLLKYGSKSWPKTAAAKALATAVEVSNAADGFSSDDNFEALPDANEEKRAAGLEQIKSFLDALDREEPAFILHLARATNRKIEKLEDLTSLEIEQQIIFLEGIVDAKAAKLEKLKSKPA